MSQYKKPVPLLVVAVTAQEAPLKAGRLACGYESDDPDLCGEGARQRPGTEPAAAGKDKEVLAARSRASAKEGRGERKGRSHPKDDEQGETV